MSLLIRRARVLTLAGPRRPRRGADLGNLGVLPEADVLVEGDTIAGVGAAISTFRPVDREIDAKGRVLMPGFVDCHTHACWAGERLDEWEMKLRGASYLDILKAGGGIMSTVRSVRSASEDELAGGLEHRLAEFLAGGTTTVEVKSGYGLNAATELKMLRAISRAARSFAGTVVPTALLGHAIEGDPAVFVRETIDLTLHEVSRAFPGITVDAFCEQSAWTKEQTVALFERAASLGHPVRIHADQFNCLGMLGEAVRLGARSVDHLEASSEAELAKLGASMTFGVGLPVCGMHLDGRYADLRRLVDLGGAVAIATNCNPGSAPTTSMPLVIGAAVRHCGLTASEAIAAATVNPAELLGLANRGVITPGARADLVLLKHTDERALAYELGGNPVDLAVCGGRVFDS